MTLNQSSPPTLERQRLQNEQARWHFDYRNGLESLANEDIGDPSTSFSDAQSLRKQDSAHALEAVFQNGASSSLHPFRSSQVCSSIVPACNTWIQIALKHVIAMSIASFYTSS